MSEETIIRTEHQITSMEKGSNENNQAEADNLQLLRASLDPASDMAMQLSDLYMQADFKDAICHSQLIMVHNQLNDIIDKCLQLVENINPMATDVNDCEISSIICSLLLLKTTWLCFHQTHGKGTDGISGNNDEEFQGCLFQGKLVSMFSINTVKTCIDRIDAYNKCFFGEMMNTANKKIDNCELQGKSMTYGDVETSIETLSIDYDNGKCCKESSVVGNKNAEIFNDANHETTLMTPKQDETIVNDTQQDNDKPYWKLIFQDQDQLDIMKHERKQDATEVNVNSNEQGKLCPIFSAEMDKVLEDFCIPEDDNYIDGKQTIHEIEGIDREMACSDSNEGDCLIVQKDPQKGKDLISKVDDDDQHFHFNEVSRNELKKSSIAYPKVSDYMGVHEKHFSIEDTEQGKNDNQHNMNINKTFGNNCKIASNGNSTIDPDQTSNMFEANCIPASSDHVFNDVTKSEIIPDEAKLFEASETSIVDNVEQVTIEISTGNLDNVYSSDTKILMEPLSAVLPIDWEHDSKTQVRCEEIEKFVGIKTEELFKVNVSNTEIDDSTDLESFMNDIENVRNEATIEYYRTTLKESTNKDSNHLITPFSYEVRGDLENVVVVDSSAEYFDSDKLSSKLEKIDSISLEPTNKSNLLKLDINSGAKNADSNLYQSEYFGQMNQSFQIISRSISNDVPRIQEETTSTTSAANNLQSMIKTCNVNSDCSIINLHENDCKSILTTTLDKQPKLDKKRKRKVDSKNKNVLPDCPNKRSKFLDEQETGKTVVSLFIPKTVEQYQVAINEVRRYLDGEDEECVEECSSRIRRAENSSRNKQIMLDIKQDAPFPISLYISCGILPWYVKNKMRSPVDDDQCDVKVPSCIKKRILQYRKWYPTVLDKLYCFDNHSPYLSDMKLFGCWECIRKHYNELFTWCKKVGLLKV